MRCNALRAPSSLPADRFAVSRGLGDERAGSEMLTIMKMQSRAEGWKPGYRSLADPDREHFCTISAPFLHHFLAISKNEPLIINHLQKKLHHAKKRLRNGEQQWNHE